MSALIGRDMWLSLSKADRAEARIGKTHVDEEVDLGEYEASAKVLAKKGVANPERGIPWTISTEVRDRDNDRIMMSGVSLKSFRKNPVVMWAHDYKSLPIGRAYETHVDEKKGRKRLRTVKVFATADENPEAETVFRMVKAGFIRTASIGFRALKASLDPELDDDHRGILFEKIELIESSVVPIPVNPEALNEVKGMGIELGFLKEWSERLLDDKSTHLVIPRADIEKAYEIVTGHRKTVVLLDVETETETRGETETETQSTPAPKAAETTTTDDSDDEYVIEIVDGPGQGSHEGTSPEV